MLCEKCGEREANVKIVKIVNGEKTVEHLCEVCARQLSDFSLNYSDNISFSLPDLLSQFFNVELMQPNHTNVTSTFAKQQICPKCGLTEARFTESGQVGCDQCYQTFRNWLLPLIRRVHGSVSHRGRIPERQGAQLVIEREIEKLRHDIQNAISEERFEDAATLRDRIKDLKSNLKGGMNHE